MRASWMVLAGSLLAAGSLSGQVTTVPAGVTPDGVSAGVTLYHGKGGCAPCHGDFGVGTTDGPELISGRWKLGPGTYDWLVHISRHAGWGMTPSGDAKPMRGPTVLDSTEVSQVAAYVWSISRNRQVQP